MDDETLLTVLRELELRLLRAEVRADPEQMSALLHPRFVEVGASGRTYTRDDVVAEFRGSPPAYAIRAQEFECEPLADGIVLLRYRSAHVDEHGALSRHVSRTSLWQRGGDRWQVRFHQGTPIE